MQWSEEDQCYIGYCHDLYFGGVCHGDDELVTYAALSGIIEDEVAHRLAAGGDLPVPSRGAALWNGLAGV